MNIPASAEAGMAVHDVIASVTRLRSTSLSLSDLPMIEQSLHDLQDVVDRLTKENKHAA